MDRKEWLKLNHDKVREYARAHYRRNRAAILAKHKKRRDTFPDMKRNDQYKCLYGITVEQYEALMAQQCGRCKLCEQPPKAKRLHVDHDHSTGVVRGLLCAACNASLVGRLENNPGLYQKIGDYLGMR
jgi:hypothetical protein